MPTFSDSLLKNQCLIDGAWVGTPALSVTDPATGAEIGKVPDMGREETCAAIAAAQRAFPAWSKLLPKDRSKILRRWFDLITEHTEELARLLTQEQGKPLTEARGEIAYGASFVEFFAEEAKRLYGETIPSHKLDARIVVIRQPLGVVATITPWNFPMAMIARKIAPALAAGCTVVCKPAGETPLSALALAELAQRAGVPPGVLNIITTSQSAVVGEELTSNPSVRAITFTGSTEVGKQLMRQAAGTVKKVALELGGNAPFIVFDDADLDKAAQGLIVSKFRNMGQTCVCANRVFVQDGIFDAFVAKLSTEVGKLKLGNGLEDGVTQGPLINAEAIQKVERHVQDAVAHGAQLVLGGKPASLGGTFYEPTVLTGVMPHMLMMQEETFGPVAGLVRFSAEDEVIRLANATPFGLAAYFYARDIGRVWRVAEALESGMIGINEGMISTETVPFGGVKESGFGREGSRHGLDEFVSMKYMLMAGL
ncbi:MAG TPA: NAD-dependent succinate-semialdehyde dehydrogenase [Methylobacter sp.]